MRRTKLNYTTAAVIFLILVGGTVNVFFKAYAEEPSTAEVEKGAQLFSQLGCAKCHHTDRFITRIGPGLKDILKREKLPVSGRPATKENVKDQIINPVDNMPSYEDRIDDDQMQLLLNYLETL